eukprot:TRINITY_DN1932_c0_g6_i1.p1 TRINITY_DN1932_c0_g6~~TRINITY_DN1932_c0_g6_i1.p1  ORF type:complete len:562 (+),score=217.01 TRINITY_DN1932_c0_g6_i1:316-2001(+)
MELKLIDKTPFYNTSSQDQLDSYNTQFVLPVVKRLMKRKETFEEEMKVREDLTAEEVEERRTKLKDTLDEFVTVSLAHIVSIPNLIELARELNRGREHSLSITVVEVAEKLIDKLKEELEKREELEAKLTELSEAISLQKNGPTRSQKRQIDTIEAQLKEMPAAYDDLATLESWITQVASVAIDSARVESNDRVLREQTSLAFRTAPTVSNWTQVKNLTSESDWDEVKKELVVYILNLSTDPEDKWHMDALVKSELLISEGLWQDALKVFPRPSDDLREIPLLTKLWIEVEKEEPRSLVELKPLVERYVKHYFQTFKYTLVEMLLDQVQRRHPDFISEVYEKGIKLMMVNLTAAQYPSLVRFLRGLRNRLTGIGKAEKWEQFLTTFRSDHKSKKKLLSMIDMLGDSSWNIFLNPATKEDRKTAEVIATAEKDVVYLKEKVKEEKKRGGGISSSSTPVKLDVKKEKGSPAEKKGRGRGVKKVKTEEPPSPSPYSSSPFSPSPSSYTKTGRKRLTPSPVTTPIKSSGSRKRFASQDDEDEDEDEVGSSQDLEGDGYDTEELDE